MQKHRATVKPQLCIRLDADLIAQLRKQARAEAQATGLSVTASGLARALILKGLETREDASA